MENLINPLQQWAQEDDDNRGVLVIVTDEGKSGCLLTGTYFNVSKAIAHQSEKIPEARKVLIMGLLASGKSSRFLSLRARLVKWLLM